MPIFIIGKDMKKKLLLGISFLFALEINSSSPKRSHNPYNQQYVRAAESEVANEQPSLLLRQNSSNQSSASLEAKEEQKEPVVKLSEKEFFRLLALERQNHVLRCENYKLKQQLAEQENAPLAEQEDVPLKKQHNRSRRAFNSQQTLK